MFRVLHGKNATTKISSYEIHNGEVWGIQKELYPSYVTKRDHVYWVVTNYKTDNYMVLKGDLFYKYGYTFKTKAKKQSFLKTLRDLGHPFYTCYNEVEEAMIYNGLGLFYDMEVEDMAVLSFDIETTGIDHNSDSKVLLISNTYKHGDKFKKKLFSLDEYDSQATMLEDWCDWVRHVDPDFVIGHNVFSFDFPYLIHVANLHNTELKLGRFNSPIEIGKERKYRRDGSQFYIYNDIRLFGRSIIDTFFLSIKYDTGRRYDSYGLKAIIRQEGLEKEGRQHYDAGMIRVNWDDPEERKKIKAYAIDDADDALALYELMIPAFFEYAKFIPKPFQDIINGATGSQLNSLMVRAYLQDGHSLPRASERVEYEGGISFGNTGLYHDVYKVDVASMYPSIILSYDVVPHQKDPLGYFKKIVAEFTKARLENKALYKATGQRKYLEQSNAQKIVINSAYGFLGATGLLFNSPEHAAKITEYGRDILTDAISWAEYRGYEIVNADTDSFSYTTGRRLTPEEYQKDIESLNFIYPKGIRWEDDGEYKAVLIVKAKNYALCTYDDKITIKGSALKATMKEPALREFIQEVIQLCISNHSEVLTFLYNQYAYKIFFIEDITKWCSKKTVTESVLNPQRTNEQRVLDAIGDKDVMMGDKIFVFFKTEKELCLAENFDGTYDKRTLLKKLYKTVEIFKDVVDMSKFIKYYNKKPFKELQDALSERTDVGRNESHGENPRGIAG